MTTQEGNKLIAEWMGWKFEKDLHNPFGVWKHNGNPDFDLSYELFYHENWNALMPCVEKIKILEDKTHFDARGIELIQAINKYICLVQIEDAHLYVVEFIQWHNQQK